MIWGKKKPTQLRVQVVRKEESKLRLSDWQLDPGLCAMAAKVLMDPNLQLMLSVLKNESPAKTALPYGVHMDDRVVLQARGEGYEMFLSNLERMAVNVAPVPMPEPVFEPI